MTTLEKQTQEMPYYPWCIQVEFTQGCNRRCWFCGIHGIPPEKQQGDRFISLEQLHKTFSELNDWLPKIRVEVNSHGEPTLHPKFLECIATIRNAMPTAGISVQTNTEVWYEHAPSFISEMFHAGVNALILNAYKKGLYDWWKERLSSWKFRWVDYYWNNPLNLSANRYYPPNEHIVFLWDDLGTVNQQHIAGKTHHINKRLHNSGGNSRSDVIQKMTGKPIPVLPLAAKCSKVYRELILNWDGTIPVCCQDWNDVQIVGDNRVEHIRDIWFSTKFNLIRELLFRRERRLILPCNTCDDPTTRVGLLKPSPLFTSAPTLVLAEALRQLG